MAWNAEYAYFISEYNIDLAIRYESSRERDEAPRRQYGIALTRYEGKQASFTIEYLRAEYRKNFYSIEMDEEIAISESDRFGVKLTFEF